MANTGSLDTGSETIPGQDFREIDNKVCSRRESGQATAYQYAVGTHHDSRGHLESVINWALATQSFDGTYLKESSNQYHCAAVGQMSVSFPYQGHRLISYLGEAGGPQVCM